MAKFGLTKFDEDIRLAYSDELGEKVWHLIGDWNWVNRRVESVRLNSEGDTRRHISFDFTLPKKYTHFWYPPGIIEDQGDSGRSSMALVPLSFFNKGTIVNLDLTQADGTTLPNLNFSENGNLTFCALVWKMKQLVLEKEFRINTQAIENIADLEWDIVQRVGPGIYDLIHNTSDGEFINQKSEYISKIEKTRAKLFDEILECSVELGSFPRSSSSLQYDGKVKEVKSESISNLLDELDKLYNFTVPSTTAQQWEEKREFHKLVGMLGTVCTAYLFATVIDAGANNLVNRTIVKFSCDTELRDWNRDRLLDKVKRKFFGITNIPIQYSSWQARSSHLEIRTPEKTVITTATKVIVPKELKQERKNPYESLRFRTSGERVQITSHRAQPQPVTTLLVSLAPTRSLNAVIAAIWSLMVILFCMEAVYFTDSGFLSFEQQTAAQALNLAVMGALFFAVSSHKLSRKCWRPVRNIIFLSLLLSLIPPVLKNLEGKTGRPFGCLDIFGWAFFVTSNTVTYILWGTLLCGIGALTWSVWQIRHLDKISPSGHEECQIKPLYLDLKGVSDSVMAITETGVYNTEFILSSCKFSPTMKFSDDRNKKF